MIDAAEQGQRVARVHTGDPSVFGAILEQAARLDAAGIPWEIVPGVSSVFAAAAVLGAELTVPEVTQTVILTRAAGRTPVPPGEELTALARHRSTLALFLSAGLMGMSETPCGRRDGRTISRWRWCTRPPGRTKWLSAPPWAELSRTCGTPKSEVTP